MISDNNVERLPFGIVADNAEDTKDACITLLADLIQDIADGRIVPENIVVCVESQELPGGMAEYTRRTTAPMHMTLALFELAAFNTKREIMGV